MRGHIVSWISAYRPITSRAPGPYVSASGEACGRQRVGCPVRPLPLRHRSQSLGVRDETGALNQLVAVEIARAVRIVRVDGTGPHPDNKLVLEVGL